MSTEICRAEGGISSHCVTGGGIGYVVGSELYLSGSSSNNTINTSNTINGSNTSTTVRLENKHSLRISAIDCCPKTGQIVTCSEDRTALVWTHRTSWVADLVLLRFSHAATSVKFSPTGDRIAVGSVGVVAICTWDEGENWWVSRHAKKGLKGSVLSVAWRGDGLAVASGSVDGGVTVHSVASKKSGEAPFGSIVASLNAEGWVTALAFSSTGTLAFITHGSTISLLPSSSPEPKTIQLSTLPPTALVWVSDTELVFAVDTEIFLLTLPDKITPISASKHQTERQSGAFSHFQSADRLGTQHEHTLQGAHVNTIRTLTLGWAKREVVSSGSDGRVVAWVV